MNVRARIRAAGSRSARGYAQALVGIAALLVLGCDGSGDSSADSGAAGLDLGASLTDPEHPSWREAAPDTFRVLLRTTKGEVALEGVRSWAPLGADRFYNLVRHGYYDDARFHRVVPGFIVQWGLAADPAVTAAFINRPVADDPVVASNARGTVAFAFTEPGTRSTQVYVNLVDNARLDSQGFAPFARVVAGMEVLDALYGEYGEGSGGGMRAGGQDSLIALGNTYLDRAFPQLDQLLGATLEPPR